MVKQKNKFGICSKKDRHRTIMGEKIDYYVYYETKNGLSKNDRKDIIHNFKHQENKINDKMIKIFIDEFVKTHNLKNCVFVAIPSKSDLNNKMLNILKDKYNIDISFNLLDKNIFGEITYSMGNELSQKSKKMIEDYLTYKKLKDYNEIFQVKKSPRSVRKYCRNTYKVNDKELLEIQQKNKEIILIDDTIDEGTSFIEAQRTLKKLGLKVRLCCAPIRNQN